LLITAPPLVFVAIPAPVDIRVLNGVAKYIVDETVAAGVVLASYEVPVQGGRGKERVTEYEGTQWSVHQLQSLSGVSLFVPAHGVP
jgi:hypothetical protein